MLFERIRELRESTGMSARKFAEELGIKYTTYYGYETGTREPGSEFIANFARRFGVTTDYILGLEPKKSPESVITDPEEPVTRDQLVDALQAMGFLDENGQLSDADLKFLSSVVALLDEWFNGR